MIKLLKGEHIIYDNTGIPIYSNKPIIVQKENDKDRPPINYIADTVNEFSKMMAREFK